MSTEREVFVGWEIEVCVRFQVLIMRRTNYVLGFLLIFIIIMIIVLLSYGVNKNHSRVVVTFGLLAR